jgi:hypothetical protein
MRRAQFSRARSSICFLNTGGNVKQSKKQTKKLALNTQTIKMLDAAHLGQVAGGLSYTCTNVGKTGHC